MSEETKNNDADKYAIVVRTPDLLAQRDELTLAEAAEQKEGQQREWHRGMGAISAGLALPAFVGNVILGSALHSPVVAITLGIASVGGLFVHSFYRIAMMEDTRAADKARNLRKQFRQQSAATVQRLHAQAEAMLAEKLDGVDYPRHGEEIPLRCEDGSDKIVKIITVQRGTTYDDDNKPITITTVTARLHDAVEQKETGALIVGPPMAAVPLIKHVRQEELQL